MSGLHMQGVHVELDFRYRQEPRFDNSGSKGADIKTSAKSRSVMQLDSSWTYKDR